MGKTIRPDLRDQIASAFESVEDVTYIGLGVLLALSALTLLGSAGWYLAHGLLATNLRGIIVELLDQILLILMIIEILYTVQLSFREHILSPEPFLIVGLIAAVRRILIITAEFSKPADVVGEAFRNAMFELGLLTVLILSLVVSLYFLKKHRTMTAERS
jgi:hypothetical protein